MWLPPPPITLENVHWVRDGPKFVCRVDGCNASYMTKYNLIWHLCACHNVVMESSKPKHPSTRKESPRHQNHMAMNARVLNNLLAQFRHNEEGYCQGRKHALFEWDRLQVDLQYTPEVPKPALVRLASNHILWHDCIGCGVHPTQHQIGK